MSGGKRFKEDKEAEMVDVEKDKDGLHALLPLSWRCTCPSVPATPAH